MMILRNLQLYGERERKDLLIQDGSIASISPTGSTGNTTNTVVIDTGGLTAFPGFINSHDHLDFNLYPQLGNGPYPNYTAWGNDIHLHHRTLIDTIQQIPVALRTQWGIYKNLLNGCTTVVDHGKEHKAPEEWVYVHRETHSLHSVAFEKKWKQKLNHPFRRKKPYVIHAGEGTDQLAKEEAGKIIRANYLQKKMVAVHAVTMKPEEARGFQGIIWCPSSNDFMFGTTAAIPQLKQYTRIVMGTDSTLTAAWSLKSHLHSALKSGLATLPELICMLTSEPAALWDMKQKGSITPGFDADICLYAGDNPLEGQLMLVMRQGRVLLYHESLQTVLPLDQHIPYSRIRYNCEPITLAGNLPRLVKEIQQYYPSATIPFELI
jgi:cytosine/adenosine deaminase-related metal-dependent hydrolase